MSYRLSSWGLEQGNSNSLSRIKVGLQSSFSDDQSSIEMSNQNNGRQNLVL